MTLCLAAVPTAARREQPAATQADDRTLQEFEAAVQKYTTLRREVSSEVPALTVTDKPAEIIRTSDALARAIERGRRGARQGEFFSEPIAKVLRARLQRVVAEERLDDVITPDADERAQAGAIRVHARFPMGSALPTMPTALLDVLPPVPSGMEYRVIGTTLILRDVDAAIILELMSFR